MAPAPAKAATATAPAKGDVQGGAVEPAQPNPNVDEAVPPTASDPAVPVKAAPAVADAVATPKPPPKAGSAEFRAILEDATKPLTAAAVDKLLSDLNACGVGRRGIDDDCAARKAWDAARRRTAKAADHALIMGEAGRKHVTHESAAVRHEAVRLVGTYLGSKPETQKLLLRVASAEKEPAVLVIAIRMLGAYAPTNPDAQRLLKRMVDHPDAAVRSEVVRWFASPRFESVEGSLEAVMGKVDNDASPQVRRRACQLLGRRGGAKALAKLQKLTERPGKDPQMYAACLQGLVRMWTGYQRPAAPSKAAWELTLKRLSETPRSDVKPPVGALQDLMGTPLSSSTVPRDVVWTKAAPWYDSGKLHAVLGAIVEDGSAGIVARRVAAKTLAKTEAPKSQLEELRAKLAEAKGPEEQIVRELEAGLKP